MSRETEAQAAAGALRAAAKVLDRMRRIGNTPVNELTDRQQQEYAKFLSYGSDTPRWLRDLADRTTQIQLPRDYTIVWKRRGETEWDQPRENAPTWGNADQAHEAMARAWKSSENMMLTELKVMSRIKAGPWEDEEA